MHNRNVHNLLFVLLTTGCSLQRAACQGRGYLASIIHWQVSRILLTTTQCNKKKSQDWVGAAAVHKETATCLMGGGGELSNNPELCDHRIVKTMLAEKITIIIFFLTYDQWQQHTACTVYKLYVGGPLSQFLNWIVGHKRLTKQSGVFQFFSRESDCSLFSFFRPTLILRDFFSSFMTVSLSSSLTPRPSASVISALMVAARISTGGV